MTYIASESAPTFDLGGTTFIGLAAPSRGATENCVWRVILPANTPGNAHSLDREETLVVIHGSGTAVIGEESHAVGAGDALVVPAGTTFTLASAADGLELLAVLPVGGRAALTGAEPFTPPWTV
ncbi:MAG: cupin domain-containing protein [Mycobacteriales bacterium]